MKIDINFIDYALRNFKVFASQTQLENIYKQIKNNLDNNLTILDGSFIFYWKNYDPTLFFQQFSKFKNIIKTSSRNFYVIFEKSYLRNDRLKPICYIFSFKNGVLELQNIKVTEKININPPKFTDPSNPFIFIKNKNYIVEHLLNFFFFTNTNFVKDKAYIKTHSDLSYGFIFYKIYDKYEENTDEFFKDFYNQKEKIIKIYKDFGVDFNKAEFSNNKNIYIGKNIDFVTAYTLLTNDNKAFLFPIYVSSNILISGKYYEEIVMKIFDKEKYNLLYGKTLEEMVAKHIIFNYVHINLPVNLRNKEEEVTPILTQKAINIYKQNLNNDFSPSAFKLFEKAFFESLDLYKKTADPKEHMYNLKEHMYNLKTGEYDRFFDILDHKLKMEVINYKREVVYPKVFNKELGL